MLIAKRQNESWRRIKPSDRRCSSFWTIKCSKFGESPPDPGRNFLTTQLGVTSDIEMEHLMGSRYHTRGAFITGFLLKAPKPPDGLFSIIDWKKGTPLRCLPACTLEMRAYLPKFLKPFSFFLFKLVPMKSYDDLESKMYIFAGGTTCQRGLFVQE